MIMKYILGKYNLPLVFINLNKFRSGFTFIEIIITMSLIGTISFMLLIIN